MGELVLVHNIHDSELGFSIQFNRSNLEIMQACEIFVYF